MFLKIFLLAYMILRFLFASKEFASKHERKFLDKSTDSRCGRWAITSFGIFLRWLFAKILRKN